MAHPGFRVRVFYGPAQKLWKLGAMERYLNSLSIKTPKMYLFGAYFWSISGIPGFLPSGNMRPEYKDTTMPKLNQASLFGSLLSTDEAAPGKKKEARPPAPKIALIDVELVRPNPAEPRKTQGTGGLGRLADSIRKHGLLNPILVRPEQDGTLTTLAGSRRLKACRELGHKTIPALVIDGDPLQISLIENLVREELNPVDEAEALTELKERGNFSLQELSLIAGRSESYTSEILSLTGLPETIKASVRTSEVQPARNFLIELAREKDPKRLMKLWVSFESRKTATVKSLREKRGKSGSTLSYKGEGYFLTIRFKANEISKAQFLKAIDEGRRNLLKRFQQRG
jgi:ParB family chromosome partitioning protein